VCRLEQLPLRIAYYIEVEPSGCWTWLGGLRKGYGRIGDASAHVVVWQLLRGPVPLGMMLDHTCRNRACVYPGHLEPVTNRENTMRGLRAKWETRARRLL
jgi:hypothetical protein